LDASCKAVVCDERTVGLFVSGKAPVAHASEHVFMEEKSLHFR
jgi:hypothetical protein